jgi:hypothetical protein
MPTVRVLEQEDGARSSFLDSGLDSLVESRNDIVIFASNLKAKHNRRLAMDKKQAEEISKNHISLSHVSSQPLRPEDHLK